MVERKGWYRAGLAGTSLTPMLRNLIVAIWLMTVIDTAIASDIPGIIKGSVWGFVAMLLLSLYQILFNYAWEKGVTLTTASIRRRVFDHVQRLPFAYSQNHHSGDIISRATNDIKIAEEAYGINLQLLLSDLLGGGISLVIVFGISWQLGLVSSLMALVFFLASLPLSKSLRIISSKIQTSLGRITEALSDILASAPITRIFNLGNIVTWDYKQKNAQVLHLSLGRTALSAGLAALGILGFLGSQIAIISLGGHLVLNNQLSLGQISFATQMVSALFITLGTVFGRLQASLAGADRMLEILAVPQEPRDGTPAVQASDSRGISVEDLSFRYSAAAPVLDKVSFQVPTGKVYALVGPSGSGKSTVLQLLLGLYPPEQGEILVNGHSLAKASLAAIREQIAYVPQSSWLYAASIAENIACAREGATAAQVEAAAKAANAHDFIMELPQDYNTPVGERGSHLSGGQRQRIAIARALLKDSPVLLLDEATSALDTESEFLVQEALETLMAGRTTLVVAHRLSTIRNVDQILVLDQGKIAEQGTHQELLDQNGVYRRLFEIQFSKQATPSYPA
jgi:ATP-binding cassette subfamily B protein